MENINLFSDFINRVNPKDVNKLQLEGLTKAGVFDELEKDRNKIFNSIPKIIQKIKIINDDKINNQSSLFDNSENFSREFDFLPSSPWVKKNYYLKNLNLWVFHFRSSIKRI